MKYEKLKIISYNKPKEFEKEYEKRINNPSTFKTELIISPYSLQKERRISEERYPLFYIPIPQLLMLEDKISRNSKRINKELASLPRLAMNRILFNHILDEIQSSNEIEGVKSTRKELEEAAQHRDTKAKVPYRGIVSKYLNIIDSKYEKIEKVEDIRFIYDNFLLDDLDKDDLPDGKIFKKDPVYVSGKNKNVHQGSPNEEAIIKDLEDLIIFMNSGTYPFLAKSAITHYFLEYIHPFYEGNGRLGRFILSSYLARKTDVFTGISFSSSVRENKKKYLDAFIEVSDPKNKGEVTHFLQTIYELIIIGQEKIIETLIIDKARFEIALNYISGLEDMLEEEKNILTNYIKNYIFEPIKSIEDRELANIVEISIPTLKKRIVPLVEKGILIQTKQKPSIHKLSKKFIDEIGDWNIL